MLKSAIISLLALFAGCQAYPVPVQEESNYGPFPAVKSNGVYQNVPIHMDMGFYAFSFGEPNSMAYQSFSFKLHHSSFLTITDCFNSGDTFQAFDNGIPVAVTTFPPPIPDTPTYLTNAWKCMTNPAHSKASVLLNPGHHNITIAVINSVQGGGAAFVRVDKACQRSPYAKPQSCDNIPGCGYTESSGSDGDPICEDCGDCPVPINLRAPVPCCYITEDGSLDTEGRLCNQMVNYPRSHC